MKYIVFNEKKMEFRYGSGIATYSEKLKDGRLICTDYHSTGMPQHPFDRIEDVAVSSFNLEIDGQDATYGWSFEDHKEFICEDGRPAAELVLANTVLSLKLRIVTFCGDNEYFSRELYLENTNSKPISVTRVSPLCGVLWEKNEEITEPLCDGDLIPYTVGGYMDNWACSEGNFNWRDIPSNTTVEFGSNSGRSGHSHPFAILQNRILGGYFVCQLEWSGTWRFRFFNDFRYMGGDNPDKFMRLVFDLAPDSKSPMRVIEPGEELKIPPIHFGYTTKDFDGAIQALHDYQRKYILAQPPLGYEPCYCAHWGYEGHDIGVERLKVHIDRVYEMGFEMFLVDAGWYGKPGTDWFGTVGDWYDERILGALKEIVDYTHSKGMLFGLWIEPEAVGPDSQINKDHPEWLLNCHGKSLERCLDLSRPEVEKWVEGSVVHIIEHYGIDLLRIDANNEFVYEGGFNEHCGYMENSHWRNVEAIHRIFDHIREKFPNLLLENCAAGGGRTDLGMMRRFSRTQYTDWYKFPRAPRIFNGMSICLPPETLMSMAGPAVSCQRYSNIEAQLQMIIQGSVYINPFAFYDEEMNENLTCLVKKYINLYKSFIRPMQRDCKIYHHTPVVPGFLGRGVVINEFVSSDKGKAYATLFKLSETENVQHIFKPRGLDRGKTYKVTFVNSGESFCIDSYTLTENGITITLPYALSSCMLIFEAI